MCPIKNREDLQKFNESVSLQNQVKVVRLQDKLGKQNFHEDMNEVFEQLTNTLKKTSEKISNTFTETSIKNNKAFSDIIEKVLEIMNERGIIATYLLSPLAKITYPEISIQFKLVKDH